ncbi:lysophospholipid acyltransferase family protein [Vagococcus xieshaowenii]|uniref:1-acyl-sn-glycerol-3-phosphate acyltransferase n=1 Tax=Vagococcus xieshaowenii TaxID=2562451 RepID=A0AAJ5EED9_9ENTE|nr:1-acyl-sn-glycerol-3-phosphate acyltransferase [Vagococcus xieshaowenii]QCA27916.1 1-acyl-sn-glycerol-3-phosphate acyltransferase [Vagococcus xieshaowenii]TFZ39406.1 1-acyl-sn-glycerol-3-phosphate acyltransferase [Vagococcus xieshaowenii]
MFFKVMRSIAKGALFIVNGRAEYQQQDKLPEGNYVLVGPHRTWWDPLYFAIGAAPKEFSFMAKEELFKNPILRWILVKANAFPVNRDNPGPSVIKKPVKLLKSTELSLIMFPSGTRHSEELKGGAALIAKMAKVPIVPVVYQGPVTLGGLFKRKKVILRFGDPIDVSDVKKLDQAGITEIERCMSTSFAQLDSEINPDYKYVPKKKDNQ